MEGIRGRIRVNDSRSNTRDKKRTAAVDMVHDKVVSGAGDQKWGEMMPRDGIPVSIILSRVCRITCCLLSSCFILLLLPIRLLVPADNNITLLQGQFIQYHIRVSRHLFPDEKHGDEISFNPWRT